ncbi:hypothetical protein [Pseudanabaena sp. Chao 1811]|uniref:hypothetical protein n=1 Tax=Pseudanabaena sp. Chao 1811 TaxID=2963092 RepID=UPI0022F39564|nr:hypothetical protein [Pseudanabaena sp. Chao 1811]
MNFALLKSSFATTLLLSIITSTGSAYAYKPIPDWETNPRKPAKPISCTCNGNPVPPKLCPMIHCPDFKSSSLQTILQVGGVSKTDRAETNDLIAGRYRERGPGGGIGRQISANNADATTLVAGKYPTSCTGLIL